MAELLGKGTIPKGPGSERKLKARQADTQGAWWWGGGGGAGPEPETRWQSFRCLGLSVQWGLGTTWGGDLKLKPTSATLSPQKFASGGKEEAKQNKKSSTNQDWKHSIEFQVEEEKKPVPDLTLSLQGRLRN
jgi:hypothetical protein